MKIIFIPTIQHTGTWFANDILYRHSHVGRVVELASLFLKIPELKPFPKRMEGDSSFDLNTTNIVTVHFHLFEDIKSELPSGHWGQGDYYLSKYHRDMLILFSTFPTVIPVRDPVKVLLSTVAKKGWNYSNDHLVREFEYLSSMRGNPFFLPIDIKRTEEENYLLLCRMMDSIGLPYESYLKDVAKNWTVKNSKSANYKLRREYDDNGVTDAIRKVPGFKKLKEKEHIIRPFLEKLGYKNLAWWKD